MLDISAHVVAVDVGVVLVGDHSFVEPLDGVEEGEELSVGDRIEREQTLFSVYFLSSVHLHGSAAAATDRAGNSALQPLNTAVLLSTPQYTIVHHSTLQYTIVQHCTPLYNTVHYCTPLDTTVYLCTQLYTTAHHCTLLYTTLCLAKPLSGTWFESQIDKLKASNIG